MEMHQTFLTLGALFLLGLLADQIGRRTRLPRVTLLLICGVAIGASGLNLLPLQTDYWYASSPSKNSAPSVGKVWCISIMRP